MAPECLENRGLCETFWETRLRRHLSRENARQIAENVTAFFAILAEWSRAKVGGAAASSPGSPNELQATDSDYGAGRGRS
jgi:hypothetical protein